MKILIQMKTISTQTEIESQPNRLTNSASTCSKRCSLPCSWPIVISATVIFLLYLLYCPHNTIGQQKRIKNLFKSSTTFAKHRPWHTETCEAVCETNPIVSLRNKRHLTYLCDAICIAKVLQTETI
jgi:hypothetical protein